MSGQAVAVDQLVNRLMRRISSLESKIDKISEHLDVNEPDRVLTPAQAAPYLGFTTRYPVLRLIKEGKLGARRTSRGFELSYLEVQRYVRRLS